MQITSTQIRAARAAIKWSAKQLADLSGVALRTIVRIEQFDGVPEAHSSTIKLIVNTLEAAGIEFIGTPQDRPGIRISLDTSEKNQNKQ